MSPQKREVIAESPQMKDVMQFVRRIASSEAGTILIEGENGTGKDLVAKTLHYQALVKPSRSSLSIAPLFLKRCSKVSCSVMKKAPSQTRGRRTRVVRTR
jgi:Cdc6-like AAA superfamily ATPase